MKRILFLLLACGAMIATATAQKLIIGSKTPDLKGIEWHGSAPTPGQPMLIEFYDPQNASSKQFHGRMGVIAQQYSHLSTVVLTRSRAAFEQVVSENNAAWNVGLDAEGRTYQAFNIRFLPFAVLIDSKGNLFWQGNLGNLPNEMLQSVK